MFTDIESLMKPIQVNIPDEAKKQLSKINSQENHRLPDEHEYEIVKWAIKYAKETLESESYQKVGILVTPWRALFRYDNCTDTASIQLRYLKYAGYSGLAKFDGNHASVILPSTDKHWKINDDSFINAKKSTIIDRTVDIDKLIATDTAIANLGDKIGCYVFRNRSGAWEDYPIDNIDSIRSSSPLYTRDDLDKRGSFILVRSPMAHLMLQAIDVNKDLSEILSNSSASSNSTYSYLDPETKTIIDQQVRRFVPKLMPRPMNIDRIEPDE